jgi:hypothetical protein
MTYRGTNSFFLTMGIAFASMKKMLKRKRSDCMKKYLLPQKGRFYKANLHCHTTLSDGNLTPEQVKEEYKSQGYSVVAFTDHEIMVPHPELLDDEFLPLNGLELGIHEHLPGKNGHLEKDFHICAIALEPDNLNQPCFHRTKYIWGNAAKQLDKIRYDENEPDFERIYDEECINRMIRTCREKGFFVIYCHPTWSFERYPDYIRYQNFHAMEIYNNASYKVDGCAEYNPRVYEDFLFAGQRVFAVAADDNHNSFPKGTAEWDSGGGFIMIRAEKLEYRTITKALEQGHFYASFGPEIHTLWFEDGKIHVECDEAVRIICSKGCRRPDKRHGQNGQTITEASFDVRPGDNWVRITVMDAKGRCADTNAYFTDELFAE